MKKKHKNLYEGMYIINATLSEDATNKALNRITSAIESRGGEVHKIHDQGTKKLAYEIKNQKRGHFFLIFFSVNADCITDMWKESHLNEDLIRFMTLRADKVLDKIEFKPLIQE